MKVEIYDKKTGAVLESKEIENIKAFSIYFSMQCDTAQYAWRFSKVI
jgi:hypothetical protein